MHDSGEIEVALDDELLRYVAQKGSIAIDGVSLTVAGLDDDGVTIALIPETRAATTLGDAAPGRASTSRSTSSPSTSSGWWRDERRARGPPVRDDRGGDRGDPRGADGRRLRRRGPRERGRPRDGGAVRDAGGDQLHGQGGARLHLPGADRRALRAARPGPDDGARTSRRCRRRSRSRSRPATGVTTGVSAHDRAHTIQVAVDPLSGPARPRPARPRQPAQGQAGRRARAHRPHRGERRSGAPGGPLPGRGDLRGHERRRLDGARPRPRRLLRACTG